MEVMEHFNGEVAGDRPPGLRPQPDDDDAIATAVSNIITDVVNNGETAKEESRLERQIAEPCNGNAEDDEEEKELNLEGNKRRRRRRRRVYPDKDRPEATKAGDHNDDDDIKTSAEIGNVAEIHSLVSAALRGETRDAHGDFSSEDEVIELEFFDSRAADKLRSTHDAYCPHCRNPISKVVLRIRRGTAVGPPPAPKPTEKDLDLLGCLSCFKIFLPSRVAADSEKSIDGRAGEQQESESASHNGKCFGLLDWIYDGQRSTAANSEAPQKQPSDSESCSSSQAGKKKPAEEGLRGDGDCLVQSASTPLLQGIQNPSPDLNGNASATKHEPHYLGKPSAETHLGLEERHYSSGQEVHIPIEESTNEARALTATQGPIVESGRSGSNSIEVVKSLVYGGLTAAIASLTLVSSAAASGATTWRVFTIGVSNLVGGLVIMAHNFMDLYKNRPASEYQGVLGQKKHFPLHLIVALLSCLIFGLAPPVIYGFTFRERDDRDSKLIAVSVASCVFIVLLSIAKAYTQRANTFKQYSLTVLQYAVTAAMASGIAYVVGDLFGKMMEEHGWLKSTPPNVVLPSTHPSWDSY